MEEVVDRKLAMQQVTFNAHKRARRSGRNWKPRFFTLDPHTQTLSYVKPHSRKVKGSYCITTETIVESIKEGFEKKLNVLKVDDPSSGLMYLCFGSDVELFRIHHTFEDTVEYCKDEEASRSGSMIEEGGPGNGTSYMDMKKVLADEEERQGRPSRSDTFTDDLAFTELVEQFQRGSITEEEFAQIMDNKEDVLAEETQPEDEDDIDMEFNIQVTCEECSTLNNTCRGPLCRLCRADLAVAPVHFL
jgi:hypothetical protein